MNWTTLIAALIFTSSVFAETLATNSEAPASPKAKRVPAQIYSEDKRYEANQVHAIYSLGSSNYTVKGGNSSVDSSPRTTSIGLEGFYNLDERWKILGLYENVQTDMKTSAGSSPTTVMIKNQRMKVSALGKVFKPGSEFIDNAYFGLGYFYYDRSADRSSPIDMVSDLTKSGPMFSYFYSNRFNESLFYRVQMDYGLISRFKENSATTGSYQSGYFFDAKYMLSYPIASFFDFSFGLSFQYDSLIFNGTGTRGISDAKEKTMNFSIPLELTFFF